MWGFDATTGHANFQSAQIRHPGAQCRNALATPNPAQTGARSRQTKVMRSFMRFGQLMWSEVPGQARARIQRPGREHSRGRGGTAPRPRAKAVASAGRQTILTVKLGQSLTPLVTRLLGGSLGVAVMRDGRRAPAGLRKNGIVWAMVILFFSLRI